MKSIMFIISLIFGFSIQVYGSTCEGIQGQWLCRMVGHESLVRYYEIDYRGGDNQVWEIGWDWDEPPTPKGNENQYSIHRSNGVEWYDGHYYNKGTCDSGELSFVSKTRDGLPKPGFYQSIFTLESSDVVKLEKTGLGPTGNFSCSRVSW